MWITCGSPRFSCGAQWFTHGPQWLPVQLPLEALDEGIKQHPDILERCSEIVAGGSFPPVFYEHPVVQGAADDVTCVPMSIFVDGVPFTRADRSTVFT